jgi:NAD(P)-dependent dehydrogenase (short-subunit alcohol dehydrogenase family)
MTKTIFITGATDGVGKLTAAMLAQDGHTVFIHGRNKDKLQATVSEVQSNTQNKNVYGFLSDFSDLDSVKHMAKEVTKKVLKLDVLINNAGIFKSPVATNKDGLDIRFVVNYLAPYIVTEELLPILSDDARIINLSSAAQSSISKQAFIGKEKLSAQAAYAQSKLALTMWSFNLAELQKNKTVIAVNPGSLLNTKMAKEAYGQAWSPADKGANILYELALDDKHKNQSGKYFDNDNGFYANAHPDNYNKVAIDELITQTRKIID